MRRQVLAISPYYLPGYRAGGVLRSLAHLVDWLGQEVEFSIITRGHDLGCREPYRDYEMGAWNRVGEARVHYLEPGGSARLRFRRALQGERPSLVYLNGFFSPLTNYYLWERLRGRTTSAPVVLAPHGEFSTGALKTRRLKKRAFMRLARAVGLHRNVRFLATTPLEEQDIRRELVGVEVLPLPCLPPRRPVPSNVNARPKSRAQAHFVYCSRVSPKKNLLGALRFLKGLRGPLRFDVYGSLAESSYVRRCKSMASALPVDKQVLFHGEIEHEKVSARIGEADLFVLPTLGENFGFAIIEALNAGTPVLISDQTPWRDLDRRDAGWDVPLADHDAWVQRMQAVIDMSEEDMARLRVGALRYARDFVDTPATQAARELFAV